MTEIQLAHFLQMIGFFLVVSAVIFWMAPTIRLDTLRQNLFSLREELFDFACEGHISFNDPAYQLLRGQMNGLIRYAHHLTVFRALMTMGMRKAAGDNHRMDWNDAWEDAISLIQDNEARAAMKRFHNRAMKIMLVHLITGSPLLWAAMLITMLCGAVATLAAGGVVGVRQLLRTASGKVLQGPLDLRLIEEAALYEPA